jgi:hypothetical protein
MAACKRTVIPNPVRVWKSFKQPVSELHTVDMQPGEISFLAIDNVAGSHFRLSGFPQGMFGNRTDASKHFPKRTRINSDALK